MSWTRWFAAPSWVCLLACMLAATPAVAQQASTDQVRPTFELAPRGYIQLDARGYPGWPIAPGEGRSSRPTVEVRRARLGVDGTFKRVGFEVSIDPQDVDGSFLKDAYAQVRLGRALRVRGGQFKAPGTRDYDVSARQMDFLERSPLTLVLGVGRDRGVRADGRLGRLEYETGIFLGDGVRRDDRSGVASATRVLLDLPRRLEVGGSWSVARTTSADGDAPNGPSFFSTSGFRFADGLYVQGRRTRVGMDIEWSPGRWRLTAEYLRMVDERRAQGLDREDLPRAIGTGFSSSIVYRLRTRRDPGGSRLANALFRHPVDLALRYDYLGLDDAGSSAPESVRPRAANIRPRATRAVVAGATWSLNRWLRLLGNVTAERFTEPRSAPTTGDAGTYLSLATRLQVEWP